MWVLKPLSDLTRAHLQPGFFGFGLTNRSPPLASEPRRYPATLPSAFSWSQWPPILFGEIFLIPGRSCFPLEVFFRARRSLWARKGPEGPESPKKHFQRKAGFAGNEKDFSELQHHGLGLSRLQYNGELQWRCVEEYRSSAAGRCETQASSNDSWPCVGPSRPWPNAVVHGKWATVLVFDGLFSLGYST